MEKKNGITKRIRGVGFCVLVGVLLCSVVAVQAQDQSVSPTGWDYGNVVVGTSGSVTFDLLAGPPSAGWMYVIYLTDEPEVIWWPDP